MSIPPVLLEEWLREFYFEVDLDIGSSGVCDFRFREIAELTGLVPEDLEAIVFHDSRTLGGDDLRAAIADRYAAGRAEMAMATHGSSEAIFLVMSALTEEGDEIVVVEPCYQQLYAIAQLRGCTLRRWRLRPEDGFEPDLDRFRELVGPRTRVVVVNFPHNPTGASLDRAQQRELVEIVAAHGSWLVWDDAFGELTYGAPPLPQATSLYERAVTLGTFSKAYGLPGLRLGWCLAPPEVLDRMCRFRDYLTLHLSPLIELIATRVLRRADAVLESRRALASRNREVLLAWVAEQGDDLVQCTPPKGGVSTFPRLPSVPDVDSFCRILATRERTLLVPGSCFGRPEHVRLGFGQATDDLMEGLGRLATQLRAVARSSPGVPIPVAGGSA